MKSEFLQLLQALAAGALEASTPSLDEQECYLTEGSSFKEVSYTYVHHCSYSLKLSFIYFVVPLLLLLIIMYYLCFFF